MSAFLYIRTATDDPHRWDPFRRGTAACGESLADAVPITTAQALVFLADRRCIGCFPEYRMRGQLK